MSSKTAIVTDSTSNVPIDYQNNQKIHTVFAYVNFGDTSYTAKNMTLEELHTKIAQPGITHPTTAQPSANDFLEKFEELKAQGYDSVLCVLVGSGLAGTLNSAHTAKATVEGLDVTLVDTHQTSAPLYVCVQYARMLIDAGIDPETAKQRIEEFGDNFIGYFTLRTMEYLFKSGRMNRFRYTFGRILNIKPVLKLEKNKIEAFEKARGLENSRERAYQLATAGRSKDDKFRYIIAHCLEPNLAHEYEERIKKNFPNAEGEIVIIGHTVTVHTGAGSVYIATYNFPPIE